MKAQSFFMRAILIVAAVLRLGRFYALKIQKFRRLRVAGSQSS
jgi:hypothetical protein